MQVLSRFMPTQTGVPLQRANAEGKVIEGGGKGKGLAGFGAQKKTRLLDYLYSLTESGEEQDRPAPD